MHFMKQPVALGIALFVSSSAFAVTGIPITKQLQAQIITVNGTTSLKSASVAHADVSYSGSGTKTLTSVTYNLVAYPPNGGTETVEICYSKPYSATIGTCQSVAPGTSGTITAFNSQPFGAAAAVWVRHRVTGGTFPASAPATPDTITINWQY